MNRVNAAPVYFDYQATTPTDPRVLEAMLPWFTQKFGNPHSSHRFGREAEHAVEQAREQVARLIGAEPREIVFTSGATESNTLAIKGVLDFHRAHGTGRDHAITVATEHKCVLEAFRRAEQDGARITVLAVDAEGMLDLGALAAALTENTALVSVMAVNNEIGIVQDLAAVGALCRARGALFHTDAAQAVGKIPLDVEAMGIDLLSISGHKLYGPKGIGALYVRRRPRARLLPLIEGGGQERGLRSGTLPTPLCVGLGAACSLAGAEMEDEARRLSGLRRRLLDGLRRRLPEVLVNGGMERRIAGNLNVAFPGIDAEALIEACDSVAVSTGSACSSAAVEPSYVLKALGQPEALARASIRIGLGRFTTEQEVDYAVDALSAAVQALAAPVKKRAGGAT